MKLSYLSKTVLLCALLVVLSAVYENLSGQSNNDKGPVETVTATYMNVLYIGVENPIRVSVAGVSARTLVVSASGCGVSLKSDTAHGPGNYIATVKSPGEVKIIMVRKVNGIMEPVGGTHTFRVKKIPSPYATANGVYRSGKIAKEKLAASNLIPALEDFDFKMYATMAGFHMSAFPAGREAVLDLPSGSGQLSDKMRSIIRGLNTGDKVVFDNIRSNAPVGSEDIRSLDPLVFTIE